MEKIFTTNMTEKKLIASVYKVYNLGNTDIFLCKQCTKEKMQLAIKH